ncbi:hypothetical protein HAHE_35990 [Haloferula helveola]|uniref:Outer membrane protein beta-barrel domain-containing protein n=1 Tax=Haloferula helveola TaxID=490095 RepID=A0ABN6H7R7_9BACT|nr:hypothetical protein HAHE_35990 [Haloferula helveola]
MTAPRLLAATLAAFLALPLGAQEPEIARHHHASPIHRHHEHPMPENSGPSFSVTLGYDSRYASEGRDSLDGDGLLTSAFEATWNDFLFGVWYGESPSNAYNELQLGLEYGIEIGPLEVHASYTHLRFPHDGELDHELSAGVFIDSIPGGFQLGLDGTYSFDANGTFYELSLTRPFEPIECLTFEPGVVFGANDGYVADGHHGANHIALSLAALISITDNIELSTYASYNFALDSNPIIHGDDALLKDFFYAGAGITLSF